MIIVVPEWLIEWLMGNLLCEGPNSSNLSLKSRNTPKPIIDGVHCRYLELSVLNSGQPRKSEFFCENEFIFDENPKKKYAGECES